MDKFEDEIVDEAGSCGTSENIEPLPLVLSEVPRHVQVCVYY